MNEADAILLAKSGDQQAFAVLYELHHPTVVRQCESILRNRDLADDASQEVFLKLHRKIGSFREEAKFSVWLCSMTRHVCFGLLRAQRRRLPRASDMTLHAAGSARERGDSGSRKDAQREIVHRIPDGGIDAEGRCILNEAYRSLPEEAQAAYTAKIVEGRDAREACRTYPFRSEARVYSQSAFACRTFRKAVNR